MPYTSNNNCCMPGCQSVKGRKHIPGLTFHEFPSEFKLREEWIKQIRSAIALEGSRSTETEAEEWTPSDRSIVCGLHFNEGDFSKSTSNKVKRLNASAFPSLENFTKQESFEETMTKSPPMILKSSFLKKGQEASTSVQNLSQSQSKVASGKADGPTIMSTRTLQTADSQIKIYFTHGKSQSEVFNIFNTLSVYLTGNLSSIAPNWQYGITSDSQLMNHTLNIYQLKSTQLGLSMPRTIQMFADQTIRILIESKDCTKLLFNNLKIETEESMKLLIENVASTAFCTGTMGFETIIRCRGAIREGKTWYSVRCNRLATSNQREPILGATCEVCRKTRLTLRRQKAKMMSTIADNDKNQLNNQSKELRDVKNFSVQNIIEKRLQSVWNELGLDEVARKWKESQEAKRKIEQQKLVNLNPNSVDHIISQTAAATVKVLESNVKVVKREVVTIESDGDEDELMDLHF